MKRVTGEICAGGDRGDTETIVNDWFAASRRRGDVVLATKFLGRSDNVRNEAPICADTFRAALGGSLQRR